MEINYKDIGKRVKEERIRQNINQERLAEMANLSLTHMSHVETGNTKVSLPALLSIANALKTPLDTFICDSLACAKELFESELLRHTQDCNENEIRIIADMIMALKDSLRKRDRK